jgi:hypothetical protein
VAAGGRVMPYVFAHFGHWWASILYVLPVVAIVGYLSIDSWRQRRKDRD